MTLGPSNSHMFLAYHIRSAFLIFEAALSEILNEWDLLPEHFYILRSDWTTSETAVDDLSAHAMMTKKETRKLINDLVNKDYVIKEKREDFYSLSPLGAALREQILKAYGEHISKATQGLSDKSIEVALSSLLTLQANIEHS